MKLIKLEIKNIRGIKHLCLSPNGKNMVIFGPNGSGKSSVVDALDFLFTGKIDRLTGEGTAGITFKKHGCHIDCPGDEAEVCASIALHGSQTPIRICRRVSELDKSLTDVQNTKIDETLAIAERGENILTRREILKYIASKASTKAQEILDLLNAREVEEIRGALVKAENKLKKEAQSAVNQLTVEKQRIDVFIREKEFNEAAAIKFINMQRSVLGGAPISRLSTDEIKKGLLSPTNAEDNKQENRVLIVRNIQNLCNTQSDTSRETLFKDIEQLRELIEIISNKPELVDLLNQYDLIGLGLKLLRSDGKCPLCDTEWALGELKIHLDNKLKLAESARETRIKIDSLSRSIKNNLIVSIESTENLVAALRNVGLTESLDALLEWRGKLQDLLNSIETSIAEYRGNIDDSEMVMDIIAPSGILQRLETIESKVKNIMLEPSRQQTAWDTLTELKGIIESYDKAKQKAERAEKAYRRAAILSIKFIENRDKVLEEVYKNIEERFVFLYRKLHEDDEGKFNAKITPSKNGLEISVDFYNRDLHPPLALHSEGHQDSMGLCLYFAVLEYLTDEVLDLIILDDVVMSVDADHRRKLCDLINENFPNNQFLITTHDRIWKHQLSDTKVVESNNIIEFCDWRIETGPAVNEKNEAWDKIDNALKSNDVPAAAHSLRRECERFFGSVCNELRSKIVYKPDARWEFVDVFESAMARYKELIEKAIKVAQKYDDRKLQKELSDRMNAMINAKKRSQLEQWVINRNVHWNYMWNDFSPNDLKPVVKAIKDLFCSFQCENCGGLLQFSGAKGKKSIFCKCNTVNWKLE